MLEEKKHTLRIKPEKTFLPLKSLDPYCFPHPQACWYFKPLEVNFFTYQDLDIVILCCELVTLYWLRN